MTGTTNLLPLSTTAGTNILMGILLLSILYFSQISFALIPSQQTFKKTFILGVKQAKKILPIFIINLLIVFVAFTLPFNWITTMPMLSLAIILLITIPALALARLNIIVATW
jgi:hypothetical protein